MSDIYRRARALGDEVMADGGQIRVIASTDEAVSWGNWREVLSHKSGAIDTSAARSLLINHDPDQLAGGISGMAPDGSILNSDAEIDEDARMRSGVSVRKAVKKRQLNGISIGYAYDEADTSWNADTRTLTVHKWRLLEISLTPIPADARAQVRSMPFARSDAPQVSVTVADTHSNPISCNTVTLSSAATPAASTKKELRVSDSQNIPTSQGKPTAETHHDEGARAQEMAKLRDERDAAVRENAIRSAAMSHGVDTKDLDFSKFKSEADGLRALLGRKAEAEKTDAPKSPVVAHVVRDQADKLLARAKGSLYALARMTPPADEKKEIDEVGGVRPMNTKALIRALAKSDGHQDAEYWSDIELGMHVARHIDLSKFARRDASGANKTSAGFTSILANVANKVLEEGLSGYNASTWQQWCTQRSVPNFLQVTNAGLAEGRLTETAEDVAFPELAQADTGYNSQLGLWGATISLTYQTIINDQLGAFMASLRRAGAIAGETVDRQVYYKLLQATWTNDASTSSGLSTPSNLDKPRAALKAKTIKTGTGTTKKMGIVARFVLHDPANASAAQVATGAIFGPGQTTAPSQQARQIAPIESHWISDTGLKTGVLTTDYYTVGDPNVIDTVLVNFLDGVGFAPFIMPMDAGAVAAEKWKIMLPFQAVVATHSDGTNTRVSGMQKATA